MAVWPPLLTERSPTRGASLVCGFSKGLKCLFSIVIAQEEKILIAENVWFFFFSPSYGKKRKRKKTNKNTASEKSALTKRQEKQ